MYLHWRCHSSLDGNSPHHHIHIYLERADSIDAGQIGGKGERLNIHRSRRFGKIIFRFRPLYSVISSALLSAAMGQRLRHPSTPLPDHGDACQNSMALLEEGGLDHRMTRTTVKCRDNEYCMLTGMGVS